MRSGGHCVHFCRVDSPIDVPKIEDFLHVLDIFDWGHNEVLDEDSFVWGFFQVSFVLFLFSFVDKEIPDLLIVDFDEACPEQILLGLSGFGDVEEVRKGSWDDALQLFVVGFADHGPCLPGACLTIGKYGAIVALSNTLDQAESSVIIDFLLSLIRGEDVIKAEFFLIVFFLQSDQSLVNVNVDTTWTAEFQLPLVLGANSNCDLNGLGFLHFKVY